MLFHLARWLMPYSPVMHVIHYVSFRTVVGLISGLAAALVGGSFFLRQPDLFRAPVRENTPESHQVKHNTPTMGGIIILLSTVVTSLLWCDLTRPEVWVFLLSLLGFGAIGLVDDWCKISFKKGIVELHKIVAQICVGLLVATLWYFLVGPPAVICIPFLKTATVFIGPLLIVWSVFVLIATCNAVNLTDGLDGLATGSLILNFGTFSLICYLAGHAFFSQYLAIPFTHTSEITVLGAILSGSSLGFLWYNTYPAQLFMGDVGSLSLGSGLALMALMARQELLLPLAGGVFVVETLSVILQVIYFKTYKKRLFKMAPLHHDFELRGLHEAKITTRFTIATVVLCLLALITLKIR